jgi:hypothetical protein
MRRLISLLWNFIFGCRHPHDARSRVWTDEEGQYQRCLQCGARLKPKVEFTMRDFLTQFWSKVDTNGDCWEWKASKRNGYGQFALHNGHPEYAHRIAWELGNAQPIPDGMEICHRCDNRGCVRPEHLFLGTQKDNIKDAANKGRLWFQRYPERVLRGDRHPKRMFPEINPRGERNGRAVLVESSVRAIRSEYVRGLAPQLARKYGVSESLILAIVRRETWKHLV